METTESRIRQILRQYRPEPIKMADVLTEEEIVAKLTQATTLDTQVIRYVEWCNVQVDGIDAKITSQAELRALVYQAQHYRFQAGILCEAANFVGDEAERALQAFEGQEAQAKLDEALKHIDTLTSLFCEALDKISEKEAPKTEPPQAGPCWEGPDSDPRASVRNGAQEASEETSDADTLQA